jgi:hypothetical protein
MQHGDAMIRRCSGRISFLKRLEKLFDQLRIGQRLRQIVTQLRKQMTIHSFQFYARVPGEMRLRQSLPAHK